MWNEEDEEEALFWEWWDSGEEEEQRKAFKAMFGGWKMLECGMEEIQ